MTAFMSYIDWKEDLLDSLESGNRIYDKCMVGPHTLVVIGNFEKPCIGLTSLNIASQKQKSTLFTVLMHTVKCLYRGYGVKGFFV